MSKFERAKAASDAVLEQINREMEPHAQDADFALAFHAMLLSGVLGIAAAQIGEPGVFELWDLVRRTGKKALQFINADTTASAAVKH